MIPTFAPMQEQNRITVDLTGNRNKKQREFFDVVMNAVSDSQKHQIAQKELILLNPLTNEYNIKANEVDELELNLKNAKRQFFYGGAIRGGKTVICMAILCILCKIYPKSRWHIIRKSFPALLNSVNSMQAILRYSTGLYWKRDPSEYYVQFENGSRIYFMSENYNQDKQLTKFLGLETNGILFEQLEEIQEYSYGIIISRSGSWYHVDGPMPPPINMSTFNPTYGWLKKRIYENWKLGALPEDHYFLEALPTDNGFVTDEQWKNWENLDPDTYAKLIKGVWDIQVKGQWYFMFNDERNVAETEIELDWRYDIGLSFDFNVDPMTCIMYQTDGSSFYRVIMEFRIPNSDTYEMCRIIKPLIIGREHTVVVTGDASGKNRISGTRGHINHYQIIKEELDLKNAQFKVPSVNPAITDSRVFVASLMSRLPEFKINPSCEHLIKDVKFVLADEEGDFVKTGMNPYLTIDNKFLSHLGDCLRYSLHISFINWLKIPKS